MERTVHKIKCPLCDASMGTISLPADATPAQIARQTKPGVCKDHTVDVMGFQTGVEPLVGETLKSFTDRQKAALAAKRAERKASGKTFEIEKVSVGPDEEK